MKVEFSVEISDHEIASLQDVFLDEGKPVPSPALLIEILSKNKRLFGLGIQWGFDDTVLRDNLCEAIREGKLIV